MAHGRTDSRARTEWRGTVVPEAVRTQSILLSMNSLLSRKWYPVIVYQLLVDGPMGFSDLEDAIGDVSSKMLSESLKELESDHGVLERTVENDRPLRVTYELTERGRDLGEVIFAMQEWGEAHLVDGVVEEDSSSEP